ncbi:hypothetical protein LTR08_006267 [Meristemomyces frigidus]|nr:hypothetical protein LTR08_006267 [Meristemomyces frigidus]
MAPSLPEKRKVLPNDITELRRLLSSTNADVLTPTDSGYDATVERWSRAAEKPSGVSIAPTSAEQIAIAIRYATEQNLEVAVKGGGHSTAGASSTDGGLLIDLGRMRNVLVDLSKQRLHVQGGCLWSDVDNAAWEHRLATVGGTVDDTGVGGLTLGGGYGMLSGQRGLVIDNVVSATVVLASGEIVTASEDENADLFWALLGAGQNFGVTTEFVLQAYQQSEVYKGTMVFLPTPENITKLVAAVNHLYHVAKGGRSKKCMSLLAKAPDGSGNTVLVFIASYDGPEAEGKAVFQHFTDIGPCMSTMCSGPYPEVNKMIPVSTGLRSSIKGAAYVLPIRDTFFTEMMGKFEVFHGQCGDAGASLIAWELFDPTVLASSEKGCFANRGYHMNTVIMPVWTQATNDMQCREWAREMSFMFKHELETHGLRTGEGASVRGKKGATLLYGNYDQNDEQSRDIFGDNYPRLQKLKARYDPSNVFNKLFAITPDPVSNGQ